jgi:fatty-acyl-CoA synthase
MTASIGTSSVPRSRSVAQAWMRSMQLTKPITESPHRIFGTVIDESAQRFGDSTALLSEHEHLSYRELSRRAHQYARWALQQGWEKGDVVCLLMTNRPEYMAIWLGLTSVGVIVSLLNSNLLGASLAHCIRVVFPRAIIVDSLCADRLIDVEIDLGTILPRWLYRKRDDEPTIFEREVSSHSAEPLSLAERRGTVVDDTALLIYTSGTTGLPKAACISHARVMQWTHWFAGMMDVQADDRMYNCLPMYHSIGGVQAPGAVLVAGGSVVLREKFSARRFWDEVVYWDCTIFQYIGELCRYLLLAPFATSEREHRIRLACGNGMATDVWESFKDRFRIPQILEFYAATEGNVSLFNVQGKPGAIGHIPPYVAHRYAPSLLVVDRDSGEPVRDGHGLCLRCAVDEPGEALGRITSDTANVGARFEGYLSMKASEEKILLNVFELGDAWFRTGDLLRQDAHGFFYFVDRLGDTFRRKGENVATSEVAAAINAFPGMKQIVVYGVTVPGNEGRVGMAAVVTEDVIDLNGLHNHLCRCLPAYARPLFLRLIKQIQVTGTFKYSKTEFARQSYDPTIVSDPIYFDHQDTNSYVRLDADLYDRIQRGDIRV